MAVAKNRETETGAERKISEKSRNEPPPRDGLLRGAPTCTHHGGSCRQLGLLRVFGPQRVSHSDVAGDAEP